MTLEVSVLGEVVSVAPFSCADGPMPGAEIDWRADEVKGRTIRGSRYSRYVRPKPSESRSLTGSPARIPSLRWVWLDLSACDCIS